ncbi:putative phage abortive infection protein [Bacteroides sp.]|uniref:putative phage abortive infection protein n=1 Tax=Bacteroides sp. TaxID=29523 RepID=UPI0026172DD9|nr:putative phage abortive infection protein [Bacteroides sp.]MDD3037143.1 putative phage abortive infection protein [Bacteroides sp.]
MSRIRKYVKDWLVLGTVIIGVIIIVILGYYFNQTWGSFENKQINWGEFGSLLGAITGLIAFVGVLFTLRQNKQQSLDSEERSVFFELLRIFISYRDSLRVQRIDWEYNAKQCQWKITPYNEFCTPEKTYRQIYVELYHTFYLEIRRGIPENFSKEEFTKRIIPNNMSREQWMMKYIHISTAINNTYLEYDWCMNGGSMITSPVHPNAYDYLCLNAIKLYIEQGNFKPIAEACKKAADHCFAPYKNQLGTYFRNAYYILEMASEFNSPKKYSKIFRAQLSKYELVLLFFNSFSSLSNPKTRELYQNADLFNNLELKDVRLKEGANDESVSRMEYINFPPTLFENVIKNEYVSHDFLKKLYDSIQKENSDDVKTL